MRYIVQKIEEDIDFGCEERPENAPVMAVVTLIDETGVGKKIRQPDQLLYDRNINQGDRVILNEKKSCRSFRQSFQGKGFIGWRSRKPAFKQSGC